MKTLLETISMILLAAFLMFLVFLFEGDPPLWEVWQQAARGICK